MVPAIYEMFYRNGQVTKMKSMIFLMEAMLNRGGRAGSFACAEAIPPPIAATFFVRK